MCRAIFPLVVPVTEKTLNLTFSCVLIEKSFIFAGYSLYSLFSRSFIALRNGESMSTIFPANMSAHLYCRLWLLITTSGPGMNHPENYQNLLVRISGYNAYFTTLTKELQFELIHRAEFGI